MGLIFPIQPDLRASTASNSLALKSSKKRFSLGMGFLFGAALLGTMFLAASPLFKLLWTQGGFLDQALTIFILSLIALYPLVAIYCWFYEEVVILEKLTANTEAHQLLLKVSAFDKFLSFRWNHRSVSSVPFSSIVIENWKGALNVAALSNKKFEQKSRYSTKGHWILKVKDSSLKNGEIQLEKRARKDDLDFLFAQIQDFFGIQVSSKLSPNLPDIPLEMGRDPLPHNP